MKAVVREHIQQLDVGLGGGIVSEKIRVETIDNPMLVIGLGGTGIDALLRLKYQINRRFKLPEDPLTRKKHEKPDNIEFIGFYLNKGNHNIEVSYVSPGLKLGKIISCVGLASFGFIIFLERKGKNEI